MSKDLDCFFFGADAIALLIIIGCRDISYNPYCSDVIEHDIRHRCYNAYLSMHWYYVQLLLPRCRLSIVSGTDAIMPVYCNTLTHRAHTICSTPEIAEQELQHLEEVLGACKYSTKGHSKDL